ncbi:hypothetical protein GLU64_00020 [Nanohaloarchaea archaeon]|nr:hypothetical protein [Candidatus Nanohaloarchaea archaeon]
MGISKYAQKMIFSGVMKLKEGKLKLSKTRAIILPTPFIASFLEESYEENGEEIFDFMFNAGKNLAQDTVERIAKDNNMGKREFLSKTIDSANLLGIGKLEIVRVNFSSEVLEVSLSDSPLVEELGNSEISEDLDRPFSLFLKGAVHGIGQEIFDKEVDSEYISSEFMGDERTKVKVESI